MRYGCRHIQSSRRTLIARDLQESLFIQPDASASEIISRGDSVAIPETPKSRPEERLFNLWR
jgi:hypothetical protein